MVVTQQQSYAVVMGDLVRSERASSIERLHAIFNTAIDKCNLTSKAHLASPLTITLGDEFQGLATSLSAALRIARELRYALMIESVECRFAIGLVSLRTPVNTEKAWNMMGSGLSLTRDKLNEKRAASLYRFAVTEDTVLETILDALGAGITAIERRWSPQQRHDIIALLAGATAADIAKARNVSVHSIYKVRGSGDFDAYVIQWHAIADVLAKIDAQTGMA